MKNKFANRKKKNIQKYTKVPSIAIGNVMDIIINSYGLHKNPTFKHLKRKSKNEYLHHSWEYFIVRDTSRNISLIEHNDSFKFTVTTGVIKDMLTSLRTQAIDKNRNLFHDWKRDEQIENQDTPFLQRIKGLITQGQEEETDMLGRVYEFRTMERNEVLSVGSQLLDILFYMNEGNHICIGAKTSTHYSDMFGKAHRNYCTRVEPFVTVNISNRLEPSSLMKELLDMRLQNAITRNPAYNNPEWELIMKSVKAQSDDLYKVVDSVNNTNSLLASVEGYKSFAKFINLVDEMNISKLLEVGV